MDPQFRTSFIPKKPIVATTGRATSSINLFSLIATVIFIAAIALSGGAFFYRSLLLKQIESSKVSLEKAKDSFEPDLINQIVRLDTRIETGKSLLSSHVAVTPLFDYLSTITLRSVRFKDFDFTYLASDKIAVTLRGEAQSYAAVALQSDVFSAQKVMKDAVLSDMSLEPSGIVSFSVAATIDPTLVTYSKSLSGGAIEAVEAPEPSSLIVPVSTTTTP